MSIVLNQGNVLAIVKLVGVGAKLMQQSENHTGSIMKCLGTI